MAEAEKENFEEQKKQVSADTASSEDSETSQDTSNDSPVESKSKKSEEAFYDFSSSGLTGSQKLLLVFIVLVSAAIVVVLIMVSGNKTGYQPRAKKPVKKQVKQISPEMYSEKTVQPERIPSESQEDFEEPMSLSLAQEYFEQENYEEAFNIYQSLSDSMGPENPAIALKDFFSLQMGICKKSSGDYETAAGMFKSINNSPSILVRCLGRYHYSMIEMQKRQYLSARTKACQAAGLISAVDINETVDAELRSDLYFFANQSLTQNILKLCGAEICELQDGYSQNFQVEYLNTLTDKEIDALLKSGSELLGKGLLGPQIERLEQPSEAPARWKVTCCGASVEELLSRFASQNSFELSWQYPDSKNSQPVTTAFRKRAVFVYLPAATAEQVVTISAGCAGLIASINEDGQITVYRPDEYSSLSEHISLLSNHTVSLWRQYLLGFPQDSRAADAHFAMAQLKRQCGKVLDALAEYKMVANRFSKTAYAPYALLNAAKIRTSLADYLGARGDLTQLIEQYPDAAICEEAFYDLACASEKAGLYEQSQGLYQKMFYLTISAKQKTDAAYGAGKSAYEQQDYENTVQWMGEFLKLAGDKKDRRLYQAYYIMGKANLGLKRIEQAYKNFYYALDAELGPEDYLNIVTTLVNAYIEKGDFIEAMAVVNSAQSRQLPRRENIEVILLKSMLLRRMGFVENALSLVGEIQDYIEEPQLKARALYESAKCYIEQGRLELGRRNLAEILETAKKDEFFDKCCLELAVINLEMGQNDRAISACKQLLEANPDETIRQKALAVMAEAYKQKKDYNQAVLALVDGLKENEVIESQQ